MENNWKPNPTDRFWLKVDQSGGLDACWTWTGRRNNFGYGIIKRKGKTCLAHWVGV